MLSHQEVRVSNRNVTDERFGSRIRHCSMRTLDYAACGRWEMFQRGDGGSGSRWKRLAVDGTWKAVEVGGGCWMLLHVRFGVLVDDLGWFDSREAAEARARELSLLIAGPRRTIRPGGDVAHLN